MEAKTALNNLLASIISEKDVNETIDILKCSDVEAEIVRNHFEIMLDNVVDNIATITIEEIGEHEKKMCSQDY